MIYKIIQADILLFLKRTISFKKTAWDVNWGGSPLLEKGQKIQTNKIPPSDRSTSTVNLLKLVHPET